MNYSTTTVKMMNFVDAIISFAMFHIVIIIFAEIARFGVD